MIIWIASYPRSGNTLTTQVFKQVFNKVCYEKYNNFYKFLSPLNKNNNSFTDIGLEIYSDSWMEFYNKASTSKSLFLIKTHHPPEDDAPCIYVLRNGLKSMESHYYYVRNIDKIYCNWSDLILGNFFPYLTWGRHLDVWNPIARPNTLIVKFEKLSSGDLETIQSISQFTQLPILAKWENAFDQHKQKNPNFFRRGPSESQFDIPENMQKLFSLVNGDWMNIFKFDGNWINHPGQPEIRDALHKLSLEHQNLLQENRLFQSQLDWMRANTTTLHNGDNVKSSSFFRFLLTNLLSFKNKIFEKQK